MSQPPTEISLEEMRIFLLHNNGKVTNHALVNHFKAFLTDPMTKDQSRAKFKEYVNRIATVKHENDTKYLLLKKKYQAEQFNSGESSKETHFYKQISSPNAEQTAAQVKNDSTSSASQSQFYTDTNNIIESSSQPKIPPRKKSVNNSIDLADNKTRFDTEPIPTNIDSETKFREQPNDDAVFFDNDKENYTDKPVTDYENEIPGQVFESVKERMQRFNRLASNEKISSPNSNINCDKQNCGLVDVSGGGVKSAQSGVITSAGSKKTRCERNAGDDDDTASLTSLDNKHKDVWLVRASQCDYHELAKLAAENKHLTSCKDPATGYTALHWAAKYGNENVAKLIAGTYKANVNCKTNGGYTPLHIAAQYGKADFFDLLVKVYGADASVRDWSGRKPHQYYHNAITSMALYDITQSGNMAHHMMMGNEGLHKIKARKKHSENAEPLSRGLGAGTTAFTRFGSLNIRRVRKTTESITMQLLGKNNSHNENKANIMRYQQKGEIKSWGSADNIQQDRISMPPPKSANLHHTRKLVSSSANLTALKNQNTNTSNAQKSNSSEKYSCESLDGNRQVDSDDSDTVCGFDTDFKMRRNTHL